MPDIKKLVDGFDREKLEERIFSYFKDRSFAEKVLKNPDELSIFVPTAYNFFVRNSEEFKNFYYKRFRKEATGLNDLTDEEKYGVLIVKARQLCNNQQNEDFLAEGFKGLKPIKYPGKERRSKSPSFGKYYDDESED